MLYRKNGKLYDTGATRGSDTTIFIGKRRDAELEWNLAFYKVNFINYWWYGLYVMLYLGIIVYLLRYGSKEKKQIFVVPFFILLFTVFEPFFMEPILSSGVSCIIYVGKRDGTSREKRDKNAIIIIRYMFDFSWNRKCDRA